jgi:hypothetical protein
VMAGMVLLSPGIFTVGSFALNVDIGTSFRKLSWLRCLQ